MNTEARGGANTMLKDRQAALITGASSGMGLVYAERLAKRGYDLILVARRRERLDELAKRLGLETQRAVEVVVADLANAADLARVEKLLSEREDIDILVNNAGVGALAPMKDVSADALENMIKINVVALTRLSHAVVPGFLRRNRGTIINLASVIAVIPSPAGAGYSGSKGYVLNFSRSLQMELAKTNVVVQIVLPGPVRTEFFEASGTKAPFPEELFMSAEDVVDSALKALDDGELVYFPSLEKKSSWSDLETARIALTRELLKPVRPASQR
jgi:short-subunit dehydrogenase